MRDGGGVMGAPPHLWEGNKMIQFHVILLSALMSISIATAQDNQSIKTGTGPAYDPISSAHHPLSPLRGLSYTEVAIGSVAAIALIVGLATSDGDSSSIRTSGGTE